VLPATPIHLVPLLRSPRNLTVIAFAIGAIAGATSYLLTRKRLTDAEREQLRRDHLAHIGRITDGSITETQWIVPTPTASPAVAITDPTVADPDPTFTTPAILLYRYRIAGVTYECAQDVTLLPEYVRQVRVDLPVQVRFDPRNPANSIVVAESWSGLRLSHPPTPPDPTPSAQPPKSGFQPHHE
jgi:hypothetical protein